MTQAESVLRRADAAFQEQMQQMSQWREAMSYCLPEPIYTPGGVAGSAPFIPNPDLYNDTAAQARRDMTSGMSSAFINASEPWFIWQANDALPEKQKPKANKWYEEATRRAFRILPRSGFYDRAIPALDHAGTIGTAAFKIEGPVPGSDSPLNCDTWDIGSYAIAENCAGKVNQIWREMQYTVDQAEREWPTMNIDKFRLLPDEKKLTQKEIFILEIIPRDPKEVAPGMGQFRMPFEGTIVHKQSKTVVWRGGWEEFPVRVYRYRRQASTTPWGVGPGMDSLASSRGANYVDAAIADGIAKMVSPPVAAMDNIRGTLDLRAEGVTMVENLNDRPQPIFTVGNMQAATLFLDKKENALRRHFHADLFAYFINDERFKTATVALQIASEKLGLFAPFAHRFLNEFVDPTLERIFMVLLRQGIFGQIPPEALVRNDRGQLEFLYPKAVQQSRMALALQQMARQDARQFLADMTPIWTIDPRETRRVNFGALGQILGAGNITMPGVLRSDEEYKAIIEKEEEAARQQQMAEMTAKFATKNPDHAAAALAGAA